jgi:fructosamine-3-kinase
MSLFQRIAKTIAHTTGEAFSITGHSTIGGGCINSAFELCGTQRSYFVKTNRASLASMFEAEFHGLQEITDSHTIRVPRPVCWGVDGDTSYIAMEMLQLGSSGRGAMARFGEQLAAMHATCQERFGWHMDNTIGSTPQKNPRGDDWLRFWREQRLGFQLHLAARKGYGGQLQQQGEQLMTHLPHFFRDYTPVASLLHGDLWSGNCSIDNEGQPVIFDPAVYYGDRETDLAMTELFGGFGSEFYAAYNAAWPLDPGYELRKTLYNLYHILNHLNLFGGGYQSQASHMMARLLAEVR